MATTPMRQPGEAPRSSIAFAIAIGLHVLAVIAVPEFRHTVTALVDSAEFVDVEPEPPAPPPPPPPAAEPPRPERVLPRATSNEPTPPPAPQQTTTAPPPEVLAIDAPGLGNWQVQQGTGTATAPIRAGAPGTTNTDGALNGVPDAGVPGGTGLVADADLSVRASAPSGLDDLLNRYFPADARQQAIEGRAIVAIEIRQDGSIGRVRTIRETVPDYGFAQACVRMVRESGRWTPGRDQQGREVGSVLRFSCDFTIRR